MTGQLPSTIENYFTQRESNRLSLFFPMLHKVKTYIIEQELCFVHFLFCDTFSSHFKTRIKVASSDLWPVRSNVKRIVSPNLPASDAKMGMRSLMHPNDHIQDSLFSQCCKTQTKFNAREQDSIHKRRKP
jgi:hypothetical protein